jgi:integrase
MTLRKRCGKWTVRFKFQGREYHVATGLAATERNRTKAQAIEAEHRSALMEGRRPAHAIKVRQFSNAAEDFLKWAKVEYRAHPNSAKRICTSFTSLQVFFDRDPVSLITAGRIEQFKTWRLTPHTIKTEDGEKEILPVRDITLRHDLHALSKFFGYATKQGWANHNPVRDVAIPSDANAVRIHVVTLREEEEYFKRAAKWPDLHDVGRLMMQQGMRPEEVTSLKKADVDLENGQLHVRQGKSPAARRTLDLTAESKLILAKRMKKFGDWIFPSKRRRGKCVVRVNNQHDALLAEAATAGVKLNFVLYDFRHTFATRAAQAGIDLATLASILGHSGLRVVMRYVHPTAEHRKAAMVRFEEAEAAKVQPVRTQ